MLDLTRLYLQMEMVLRQAPCVLEPMLLFSLDLVVPMDTGRSLSRTIELLETMFLDFIFR